MQVWEESRQCVACYYASHRKRPDVAALVDHKLMGWTNVMIAKRYGVSQPTVFSWYERIRLHGFSVSDWERLEVKRLINQMDDAKKATRSAREAMNKKRKLF